MRHSPPYRTAACALLILTLVAAFPGCKKKQVDTVPVETPATREPAREPDTAPPEPRDTDEFPTEVPTSDDIVEPTIAELNARGVLKTVYFDYDSDELSPEARATLKQNADWIKEHAQYRIVIEGHCDERGTIEYNLALGQRRAETVRDYLASLGVNSSRLRNLSYGEERPAVPGNGEAAWAKNRRAAFVIEP